MKKLSFLVATGLLVSGLAQAAERPIYGASLKPTGDTINSRENKATFLTLNQRDGAKEPTSFTLVEDTGIRCIKAPCPSSRRTAFTITGIHASFHRSDSVRYEAIEVLKNIPPNVRIAPRHLNVTESSMELVAPGGQGFIRRTYWEVEVKRFSKPSQTYVGNPHALRTVEE